MSKAGTEYGQAQLAALTWIARLRAEHADETDRQAFALWLWEDASHAAAMDEALALWEELGLALLERAADSGRAGDR